jgi:hypothetical protein
MVYRAVDRIWGWGVGVWRLVLSRGSCCQMVVVRWRPAACSACGAVVSRVAAACRCRDRLWASWGVELLCLVVSAWRRRQQGERATVGIPFMASSMASLRGRQSSGSYPGSYQLSVGGSRGGADDTADQVQEAPRVVSSWSVNTQVVLTVSRRRGRGGVSGGMIRHVARVDT